MANRLVIELQPEEAIKLQIMAKQPGSGMQMQQVTLNLNLQSAFQQRRAEAYERLLVDMVRGRLTHLTGLPGSNKTPGAARPAAAGLASRAGGAPGYACPPRSG